MKLRMTFIVRLTAGLITLLATLAWARWLLEIPVWLSVLTGVALGLLMFWVLGFVPRQPAITREGRRGLAWLFLVLGSAMAILAWSLIGSPWLEHDVAIGAIGLAAAGGYLVAAVVEFARLRRQRPVATIGGD